MIGQGDRKDDRIQEEETKNLDSIVFPHILHTLLINFQLEPFLLASGFLFRTFSALKISKTKAKPTVRLLTDLYLRTISDPAHQPGDIDQHLHRHAYNA